MRIMLASGFLLGFVALCLVLLVGLRETFVKDPVLVYEEPVEAVRTQKYTPMRIFIA